MRGSKFPLPLRQLSPSPGFIFAALFCFILHPASAEEWRLTYAVTQERPSKDPLGATSPKNEESAHTLTLSLGRQYFAVDDGHGKRVYDFAHRRMINLNSDKHQYSDWSLYSSVAGRIHELLNRFNTGASFRAAKIPGEKLFGQYDNETNLGLELPGTRSDEPDPIITRRDLPGAGFEFLHNGLSVVELIPAKERLPAAFYPRFSSFLAYECSIHPKIRRQLAATGEIPQSLVIRWQLGREPNTVTYHLQSVKFSESDSTILTEGFQVARPQGKFSDTLFEVISATRAEGHDPHRGIRDDVDRFAKKAIAHQRPLDAYLALLEYRLQSGERHPNDFRQYQREFDQDQRCQLYLACQDQSSREACRKSIGLCDSIDRTGLQKAYMLDLQRADLLQILGRASNNGVTTPEQGNETATAEKLFLTVLKTNPFLAGAYHDLGGLYDETFRSPEAWLCFDTARRLSPDHFLLKDITALELRFEHDFPDFF